jgi:hypothetical protein
MVAALREASMETKDRANAFIQLADLRLKRWTSRREYEWKFSLSLWALVVASIVALKDKLPPGPLFWAAAAVIVGLHILWVAELRFRNERDSQMHFYFTRQAEQALYGDAAPPPIRPTTPEWTALAARTNRWDCIRDPFSWMQVSTTVLLLAGAAVYWRIVG